MSSLLRVELLAVTDEFLVGQIYTVAAAFYDPADYLGVPAVPPQNAERLTAIRLSDNEFESTSLQRRVTRKIASAAMQQAFVGSGRDQLSAMIELRKTPIPSISTCRPASSRGAVFARSQPLPACRSKSRRRL